MKKVDTRDISTLDKAVTKFSQLFKTGLVIPNCIAWSGALKIVQLLAHGSLYS